MSHCGWAKTESGSQKCCLDFAAAACRYICQRQKAFFSIYFSAPCFWWKLITVLEVCCAMEQVHTAWKVAVSH